MPPTAPANRERLAQLMDDRRKELNLQWQEVAAAGNSTVKTLHTVRTKNLEIRDTTMAAIEAGLRWAPRSVEAILDGGDPVPLPPGSQPPAPARPAAPAADGQWLPPLSAGRITQIRPYADAIFEKLFGLADQGVTQPTGEQLFGPGEDAATWDRRAELYSRTERAWMIAEFHGREDAARRRAGTALPGAALNRT
jgi:hypothetical protein